MTTDRDEAFDRILGVLHESAIELVSGDELALGDVAWADEAPAPGQPSVVAVLGYAGEAMSGSLVLHASRDSTAALIPAELRVDMSKSEDALRDQLGELANQLLGRLKNRLLTGGVVLALATPATAFGVEIRLGAAPGSSTSRGAIVWDGGAVLVRLDVSFAAGFELGDLEAAPAAVMSEGDMMFL